MNIECFKDAVKLPIEELDIEKCFRNSKKTEYSICIHCLRAYPYGYVRLVNSEQLPDVVYQMCPYEGCSGDSVIDAWNWENDNVPVFNKEYELEDRL